MPQVIYRVMMLKDGRWQPWTNYGSYPEAELAAKALCLSKAVKAKSCHIIEIGASGGRIVAEVSLLDGRPFVSRIS